MNRKHRVAIVKGQGKGTLARAKKYLNDRSLLAELKDEGATLEFHVPLTMTNSQAETALWYACNCPQVLIGWFEMVERLPPSQTLSADATDFIDAMSSLNPTIGQYVRECMERNDSTQSIRNSVAAFEALAAEARGWCIGRFG